MKQIFFLAIIILITSYQSLYAHDVTISAYRDPKLPYEHYEKVMFELEKESDFNGISAIDSAAFYTGDNLPVATIWPANLLNSRFIKVRNARYIKWQRNPKFLRRITWLYPNDGCYARTAMVNNWLRVHKMAVPKNVFAFGTLTVQTDNHPNGAVTWWFHVAPIVQVNGEKYVLDPSIEMKGPLPLKDWLSRMGKPKDIKVAICESGTLSPRTDCSKSKLDTTIPSLTTFLNLEWDQLKGLGKKPEDLLGTKPPWSSM